MIKNTYSKLNLTIPEFIQGKSDELKDIPTYYYNKNNIFAVLEYLNLQNRYIVQDSVIYELQETSEIKDFTIRETDAIIIIKENK